MAYHWNKSLEIGPQMETWVPTQRPSPALHTPANVLLTMAIKSDSLPQLGRGPVTLHFSVRTQHLVAVTVGRLLTGISPHWPLKGQGLRIPEKLMGSP